MAQVSINNTVFAQVKGFGVSVQVMVSPNAQVGSGPEGLDDNDDAMLIARDLTNAALDALNENYGS